MHDSALASVPPAPSHARSALPRAGLLALLLLGGCSNLQVYTARSPTASFAGYRTYAHGMPEKTPPGFARTALTPVVWAQVQKDIDAELTLKGYLPAAAGAEPDLLVRSGSGSRTATRDESAMVHGDAAWLGAEVTADYTQATLVIDVYDAHTRQPVWHGSSRRALEEVPAPTSARSESIDAAVRAILRTFPGVGASPHTP